jgi:hypothetical protein
MSDMDHDPKLDIERIAELIAALPPAPEAWVAAAQQLPELRREADRLVALAEADASFREAALQDLEQALREQGAEPTPRLIEEVRSRLSES